MSHVDELDGFVKASHVAQLLAISRRWLAEKVKRGELPPPDRPAGKCSGTSALYLKSTVQRMLAQQLAAREKRVVVREGAAQ